MSDPSDAEQLGIIKGLYERLKPRGVFIKLGIPCVRWMGNVTRQFDPFVFLDDARLLLVKCKERGLLGLVARNLDGLSHDTNRGLSYMQGVSDGLMARQKQITLAVWEVVKGLEQGNGGET